jgi:hypothetical protein
VLYFCFKEIILLRTNGGTMPNKLTATLTILCFLFFSFANCGGGASKLYLASMTSGTDEIAGVATDENGNTAVGFQRTINTGAPLSEVIFKTSEGVVQNIAVGDDSIPGQQEGYPFIVTIDEGNHTIAYSNWTTSTVDITLTDGVTSQTETYTAVNYTDYIASLNSISSEDAMVSLAASDWGGFFGALATTVKLGTCPAAALLSTASFGWLSFTLVTCVAAAGSLWSMLDSKPAVVDATVTPVSAPSACLSVKAGTGTATDRQTCVDSSKSLASSNGRYIDVNGNSGSDQSSDFAGSCDKKATDGNCVNYTGSSITKTAAENTCATNSGIYSSAQCTSSGNVGACTISTGTGTDSMIVYYSGIFTPAMAEGVCVLMGGDWSPSYSGI